MSEGYRCTIDIDKLTKSSMMVEDINSYLMTTDLNIYLVDMEEEIKNINTIHGNCLIDYKKSFDVVSEELNEVKGKITKFDDSLKRTIKDFSDTDQLNDNDLKEISGMYDDSKEKLMKFNSPEFRKANIAADTYSVTQIPSSSSEVSTSSNEAQNSNKINTLPIGIGIAAAGVAASAGAVVLDSLNYKNKDKKYALEEYHPDDVISVNESESEDVAPTEVKNFDEVLPYKASRDSDAMKKFYGDDSEKDNNN